MKKMISRLPTVIFAVSVFAETLQAQSPKKIDRQSGGMVEWLPPALRSNKKQTDAEAEASRNFGRALPALEILQPTLDPGLPRYQPRKDIKLSGNFKGAASDVLPGLVKLWVEGFRKYYPDGKIEVPPPYAGSVGAKEFVRGNLAFVFCSADMYLAGTSH